MYTVQQRLTVEGCDATMLSGEPLPVSKKFKNVELTGCRGRAALQCDRLQEVIGGEPVSGGGVMGVVGYSSVAGGVWRYRQRHI